jgi:DNA-binding transcriptional regulator YhcF (GntR family)
MRCFCLSLFLTLSAFACPAQEVVDKIVATVSSGAPQPELITYSDLLWQMALQPNTPIDNPSSEALNRTLQLIINQRLIYQEAEKLPTINPTDKEITNELSALIKLFPSQADFMERVRRVGLTNEQLREIIRQRVATDKYLDFRFRSFTVVTPKEVSDYYRDVYVPRFQRQYPGRIVPVFEQISKRLEAQLTEDKIESETSSFLDTARQRAEITIINPV